VPVRGSDGHAGHPFPAHEVSAYADTVRMSTDDDGGVVGELAAVAEAKRELARREEVAVRRARHQGLSWAEIGTLLGVTRQTMHRKYRKVG
jgi:hypothetical protein